jgi:methyl-accepting chemotaxis protein WspA
MSSESQSVHRKHPQAEPGEDFVVPEPDGVQSGIPFDAEQAAPGEYATREEVAFGGAATHAAGGPAQSRGGLSIRLKLLLSLGLLTGVIVLLGLVSVLTLRDIAANGIEELRAHANAAHATGNLVTAIHRLYETEQALERGDSGSEARLQRRLEAARQALRDLETRAAEIETSAGDLAAGHAAMAELLDAYAADVEAKVAVLDAAAARRAAAQAAETARGDALAARLAPALEALAALGAAHWQRAGTTAAADDIDLGLRLAELERALWRIAQDVQRFLAEDDVALAEAARGSLTEVLAQAQALGREADTRSVRDGLSTVRQQLLAYGALLREAGQRAEADRAAAAAEADALADQARALMSRGEGLLAHAEQLAADAWRDIHHESQALRALGAGARWLVGITAAIGTAVGLLVLVTVPRPIVRNVELLVAATREIARGNLTRPVRSDSRDELGELAATFEHMRRNLLALVQRIQRASVQLSSSINEIQAASTEQASSAAQQASAVNELTASLNEMSQSAATLLSSSESVGGSVGDIAHTLNESDQSSTRILSSMDAIALSTEQTAERIKALNDKMDDINEAVATISMVADQTTLLSLNASIEANKAGEMGKGFSVVANEIRRLSDRSIDSAGNINGMVRDIQRATESSALAMDKSSEEIRHGVGLVRESIDALASINRGMERIREQMDMILESLRGQSDASRMVQSTATEMLSSANMVAKAASQTRSVTYELNAMATQLASAVSVFRV